MKDSLLKRLIGIERYISKFDVENNLVSEDLIEIQLEVFAQIMDPQPDDPYLFKDGYELTEIQFKRIAALTGDKLKFEQGFTYVLTITAIYAPLN